MRELRFVAIFVAQNSAMHKKIIFKNQLDISQNRRCVLCGGFKGRFLALKAIKGFEQSEGRLHWRGPNRLADGAGFRPSLMPK